MANGILAAAGSFNQYACQESSKWLLWFAD